MSSLATNPLGNYRSVTKLDAGVQHSSFQAGTICFWAKALDTGPTYFDGFNNDRGFLQLTIQETYTHYASYGVINQANTSRIQGYTGTSSNSVYSQFNSPPYNDGYDPAKWNFYIVYTDSNGGTSRIYLPEFDWTATSTTYGRDHTWLRFDIDDDYVALTDVSVYTGNPGYTDSWRTTLYNGGQIGGAANESTNRVHYFRFHKDNLRDNEGTAATDISSSAEMTTSESLPGYSGAPSLNFDGFNKYTFTGADTDSTYKLKYESNTYDLGTISNVYIAYPGTYSAEIKGATNFGLSSNITGSLGTYLTLHDNVAISHTTGGGQTLVTVNNIKGNKTYKISFNKQWTDSHASYSTRLKMYIKDSSDGSIRELASIGDYLNSPRDGILLYDAGGAFDESAMIVGTGFSVDGGAGSQTVEITGGTYGSTSSPFTLADPWYFLITMSTSDVITGKFFVGDTEVISHFLTRKQSGDTGTIGETGNKFVFEFWDTATISGVNMTVEEYNPAPKLNFDTYNKLTFSGLESGSTSNVTFDGNTYSIGTASNVYISEQGTYEAESKGTTTFALTKNVVGAINTDFPKPEGNVWDFTTTSSLTEPFYNSSLTKTGTMTHSGTYYETPGTTANQYLEFTFPTLTNNVLVQFEAYTGSARTSPFRFSDMFEFYKANNDYWRFLSAGGNYSDILRISGVYPAHSAWGKYSYFFEKTSSTQFTMYYYANGVKQTIYSESATGHTLSNGGIVFPISDINDAPYMRFGAMNQNSSSTNRFSNVYIEMEQLSGRVLTTDLIGTPDWFGFSIPPSLTHDGYKLVVKNITPTSTTLKYGSNTYEIGTATNIYVENTGDYSAEIGSAADFALTNTTVSGTIKTIEPTLSGGYFFGHALTYDGKLYGWGENSNGELGVGDNTDKTVPTLCTGIPQGEVVSIWNKSKRSQNQWAKTRDGKIWVTGEGTQYNIPGQTSNQTSFIDVTSYFGDQSLTANNITHISGHGVRTVAALTETGNVWTWGTHNSSMWNLGQGTGASSSNTPKQITFGGVTDNITRFEIGNAHGVALDTDGDVWFWGQIWANGAGVDYPQTTLSDAQKSPHEIMTSNNIIGVSSTYFTIYAWQSDGTYYALGQDSAGQIGDGTATAGGHTSWQKVDYFSANNITINEIYGGAYHVFADTSDGYYCWGGGTHGNFGNGSTGDLESPTKWTNVSNIKVFSSGSYECPYAITEDGKYYAWGNGTNNARGDNTTGDITYPKYIDTLPNILAPSFDFDGYDKILLPNKAVKWIPLLASDANTHDQYIRGGNADSSTNGYWYNPDGSQRTNGPELKWDDTVGSWILDSTTFSFNCRINKKNGTWSLSHDHEPGTQHGSSYTHDDVVLQQDTTEVWITTNGGAYIRHRWKAYFEEPYNYENTKYTKDTHTYDANQAQIVTVSDPGTYDAQIKSDTDFSLKSTTIPATKATGLYTWAFHHGNFDNAYGDGDILTARDNGRFYADTPSYTGDIGTITPTSVSSFVYKFYCTVLPQLDTQSVGDSFMSTTEISSTTTTLTSAMFEMADPNYVDSANDIQSVLFNGNINASGGYFVIKSYNDGGLAVDRHMFTITSPVELLQLSITTHRPGYMPGFKIILNDTHTLINETSNGGGSGSPSPYTKSHTFSSNYLAVTHGTTYTFTPASALTANVLMVAGGGGGGGVNAGGGGAGGLVYSLNESISTGSKTIVVGNGGLGGEGYNNGIDEIGIRGKDTTFLSYTASGGGGGGSQDSSATTQIDGGSGGGNNGVYDSGNGGSSTQNAYSGKGFGNTGGDGVDDYNGGGGGGAGGAGGNATGTGGTGGAGGIGKYYGNVFGIFYGENGWFAGGGGGASQTNHGTIGLGGLGGGGRGKEETGTYDIGFHGMSHTGGGGGAAGYTAANSNRVGGTGGTGIVLLQTDVATPNVNSEVKIPEPHCHVLIEKPDDTQFSHLPSLGNNSVHASGSIVPNIPRADGSVSNVYYSTSTGYFTAAQAGSLVSTVEGIFYPIQQERYDNILEIGHNSTNDVELEMAADGTAKLYRNNGGNELASGTVKCFTVGKWHHIALTLDTNRNAVGYVNGYPVVSATYASAKLPLAREQMCLYRTGVTATFRKFLMYYFKTYNSVLNQKQIMALAGTVRPRSQTRV